MIILRSPVFITCAVLFFLHQLLQKALNITYPFLDRYLDNLLAMPIILTLLLAERRWLFKKGSNYLLPLPDTILTTTYIIFMSEIVFPLLSSKFVTDWKDAVFYTLGSFIFYFAINRNGRKSFFLR